MPEDRGPLPEPTHTGRRVDLDYCQRCGTAFSTFYSGWYIDTNDIGPDAESENARLFREDAEQFGEWQGFEEEDVGPWCDSCSWVLQRKRTANPLVTDGGREMSAVSRQSSHGELKRHLADLVGADPSRYSRDIGVERHKKLTVREIDLVLESFGLDFLKDETAQTKKDTLMLRVGRDHRTGVGYWDTNDLLALIEELEKASVQGKDDRNSRPLHTDGDQDPVTDGGREREATLEGTVRETRKGKKLGFIDTEADSGFRAPTDAENDAMDAIREACEAVDVERYESGELAAEVIVWSDGETEIRYHEPHSSDPETTTDGGENRRPLPEPGSRECPRIGIDADPGHTHYHDDEHDRMLLTKAGDVEEVHDLDGRSVESWIDHVRDKRGWDVCFWEQSGFAGIAESLGQEEP